VQSKFRLSRSEDFKRVRRIGKSYAHPLVVLVMQARGDSAPARMGVVAGKATGNAVQRNRAKRLLREAMQPLLVSLLSGWDLILIARPAIATVSLEETRLALTSLLQRAQILPADES